MCATDSESSDHDEKPFVKAFRGLVEDYKSGVIDAETMETAMDTLFNPEMAASLGMDVVDEGIIQPDWDDELKDQTDS